MWLGQQQLVITCFGSTTILLRCIQACKEFSQCVWMKGDGKLEKITSNNPQVVALIQDELAQLHGAVLSASERLRFPDSATLATCSFSSAQLRPSVRALEMCEGLPMVSGAPRKTPKFRNRGSTRVLRAAKERFFHSKRPSQRTSK